MTELEAIERMGDGSMEVPKKGSRTWLRAVWATIAVGAVAAGAAFIGYTFGTTSNAMAQSAYEAGFEQARVTFCNLELSDDNEALWPGSVRVEGLPENLVPADASCTDWQILTWNASMAERGEAWVGCRYEEPGLMGQAFGAIGACTAPVDVSE